MISKGQINKDFIQVSQSFMVQAPPRHLHEVDNGNGFTFDYLPLPTTLDFEEAVKFNKKNLSSA